MGEGRCDAELSPNPFPSVSISILAPKNEKTPSISTLHQILQTPQLNSTRTFEHNSQPSTPPPHPRTHSTNHKEPTSQAPRSRKSRPLRHITPHENGTSWDILIHSPSQSLIPQSEKRVSNRQFQHLTRYARSLSHSNSNKARTVTKVSSSQAPTLPNTHPIPFHLMHADLANRNHQMQITSLPPLPCPLALISRRSNSHLGYPSYYKHVP